MNGFMNCVITENYQFREKKQLPLIPFVPLVLKTRVGLFLRQSLFATIRILGRKVKKQLSYALKICLLEIILSPILFWTKIMETPGKLFLVWWIKIKRTVFLIMWIKNINFHQIFSTLMKLDWHNCNQQRNQVFVPIESQYRITTIVPI